VSVLFRVRLALGSYWREGGEPYLFNLIIVPSPDSRSSIFLAINLTTAETCESLGLRQGESGRSPPPIMYIARDADLCREKV
jgi:hypothetical protein